MTFPAKKILAANMFLRLHRKIIVKTVNTLEIYRPKSFIRFIGETMNGHVCDEKNSIRNGEPVSKAMKMSTERLSVYDECMNLQVQRLTETATLPKRGSEFAAGLDLYSSEAVEIPAGGMKIVPTGIAIALPPNSYGRIAPRSSLAAKHMLDVGAGVIDEDYRGPVGVVMFNFGKSSYLVEQGHRIAQLVVERIWRPEVEEVTTLSKTKRGAGGYGSTGLN